jgi:hypothetical protein
MNAADETARGEEPDAETEHRSWYDVGSIAAAIFGLLLIVAIIVGTIWWALSVTGRDHPVNLNPYSRSAATTGMHGAVARWDDDAPPGERRR